MLYLNEKYDIFSLRKIDVSFKLRKNQFKTPQIIGGDRKMKNAVIYVFSGTGNTLKIARAYADEFFSRGVSCKIHILEKDGILRFPPPQDFDLAGLAYPIHAFNAPYVVHRFAAALPDLPYKEYFIIKSSGEPLAINNISSGSLVAKLEKRVIS